MLPIVVALVEIWRAFDRKKKKLLHMINNKKHTFLVTYSHTILSCNRPKLWSMMNSNNINLCTTILTSSLHTQTQ
ncbi:hypothetical protein CR513_37207, partial [Mucuna pruriens]